MADVSGAPDGFRLPVPAAPDRATFTCPQCGAASPNPNDVREGYCGRCHDWTGDSAPRGLQLDLATALVRVRQIRDECGGAFELTTLGELLLDRLITCDLPRLSAYLTAETRDWLAVSGIPWGAPIE